MLRFLCGSIAEVALNSQRGIYSVLCAICFKGRLNLAAYPMCDGEGEIAHPPHCCPLINYFPRRI
jgi:hypothetical protein